MLGGKNNRFDGLACIRVRPNSFNVILVPDDSANDDYISESGEKSKSLHAHMNSKIVRLARQIIDKRLLDEEDDCDCDMEQLNQRITKMENVMLSIVDKLNDLSEKKEK